MTKIQKGIGMGAGGVAILTFLFTFWGVIGWVTPNQQAAAMDQALGDVKEFRDEWKCDEYDEELLELREALVRAQAAGEPTTRIEHEIDKIEKKMEALNCSRFEDFG